MRQANNFNLELTDKNNAIKGVLFLSFTRCNSKYKNKEINKMRLLKIYLSTLFCFLAIKIEYIFLVVNL